MRVPVCMLRNRPVRFKRLACVALLINQTDLFTILLLFSMNVDMLPIWKKEE